MKKTLIAGSTRRDGSFAARRTLRKRCRVHQGDPGSVQREKRFDRAP
jgi:hypothetical protein